MKKKRWIMGALAGVFAVLTVISIIMGQSNEFYKKHLQFRDEFGLLTYETLKFKGTEKDRQIADAVIKKVEEAFSYLGSEADSPIEAPYNRFCQYPQENTEYFKIEYDIEFISAKTFLNRGYVWLMYSVKRYYSDDENDYNGSRDAPCVIILDKQDGEWVAIEKREPA